MSKVVYALIGGTYYKLDQNPNVPERCVKNISNSVSYVERPNLDELELKVNLSTIDPQTTNSNREECNIMKSVLRACPNIREIQVIPNRYKMKLTYSILDNSRRFIDSSSTMRDVSAEDVLLALGVNNANEALYRRVKYFNPNFKFLVRNIVPYGIMQNAKKDYTFLITDISLYQQTVPENMGENLHLSTYDNPYSVCSPCMNEPLEDMLLLYSSKNEGIVYEPVKISYVPRSVYVNITFMKDGYLSFYNESEIQTILDENASKPHVYKSCDTVITVNNRVELNDDYSPETPELFNFILESSDPFLPDERSILIPGYGSANFGTITYTVPGVFNYKITQKPGTDEMYNYSEQVFNLRVTVSEHEYVLNAKVDIFDENGNLVPKIEFVNYYGILATDMVLSVTNTIRGTQPEEHEIFTYSIAPLTVDPPMPDFNIASVTGDGEAHFNPITFKTPGEYKYSITQVPGISDNCIYDESDYIVTVNAEKVANAIEHVITIEKNDEPVDKIEFINVYETLPVSVIIPVNNTVTGDIPDEDENFSFVIRKVTSNAPDIETDTIVITGASDSNFGPIEFREPGYFVYQICEVRGGDVHYEYDKSVYYAMFTVEDVYGKLKVNVEYALNDLSTKVEAIVFMNRYNKLDETTAIGITTRMITDGTGKPNNRGYMAYYALCRPTNPNALTVVADDTPAEEYDDATMVPKTCIKNDLPTTEAGATVLFVECVTTTL